MQEITPNVIEALESIEKLKLVEYIAFIRLLNQKFAKIASEMVVVPSRAPGAAPGDAGATPADSAPAAASPGATPEAKKASSDTFTIFNVKLIDIPADKRLVFMKNYRKLKPGMGMTETKDLVTNLPSILMKDVPESNKKEWEDILKESGCKYEFVGVN